MPVEEEHFTTIAIVNAPQFNVFILFSVGFINLN